MRLDPGQQAPSCTSLPSEAFHQSSEAFHQSLEEDHQSSEAFHQSSEEDHQSSEAASYQVPYQGHIKDSRCPGDSPTEVPYQEEVSSVA